MPPVVERLEVDWDGDGSFSHPLSDVTADVLPGSLRCRRGREYGTQVVGRSTAGRLSARLSNDHRRYDPENTASPLAGLLTSGPRVRWTVEDPDQSVAKTTIWGGYLDNPALAPRQASNDVLRISAYGVIARLNRRVSVPYYTNIATRTAAGHVAAAVGLQAGEYMMEGSYTMPRWGVQNLLAIDALRDIEETERGFLYEDMMGRLRLASRGARIGGDARVSAMTLSDKGTAVDIFGDPTIEMSLRDVFRIVQVPVRSYASVASAVLWTAPQAITVPGNDTVVILARYPTPNAPAGHIGVDSWVALAAGTDYASQTGLTVTSENRGDELAITLENTTSSDIMVPSLQARGEALVENDPLVIQVEDPDAVTDAIYPSRDTFYANSADAQGWAEFLLTIHGEPRRHARVSYLADDQLVLASGLDLSRRVTLDLRGVRQDNFIEAIDHRLRADRSHETTYTLAPVLGYTDVIILDEGPGLGVGVLG